MPLVATYVWRRAGLPLCQSPQSRSTSTPGLDYRRLSRPVAPAMPWAAGAIDVTPKLPGAYTTVMVAEWLSLKLSPIDVG